MYVGRAGILDHPDGMIRYDNTYPTFVLIYLGRAGILEHPDGEFCLSWRTIQENPGLERF